MRSMRRRGMLLVLVLLVGCSSGPTATRTTAPQPPPPTPATRPAPPIDSFQGEYRFLSNFYPAQVIFEGITYPTAEHAYQAAKSLDPNDRKEIAAAPSPAEAKRAGRALKLRNDWETAKFDVMERVVRDKFTRNAELRDRLLATGDAELIEGNTWGDRIWGVYQGEGENHLGRILMNVRGELRAAGPATTTRSTTAPAAR